MKKSQLIASLLLAVCMCVLTGCWDAKEIQHINYITALGIDYVHDRFIVYAQMLDFTSVAKQEGGKPSEPAQVWVSKTEGVSVNEAIDKLYRTAQQQFYYSHINAIIYSENVLRHGADLVFDITNRYREIRYTKWAYSSRLPMDLLLSAKPFFDESPLSSILHEPKETYRQNSYIQPIQFQRFISYYNEKGKTAYLPTLALNDITWKNNLKKQTLLEVDGCLFIDHHGKLKGFIPRGELIGWRWLDPATVRTPIFVTKDKKIVATVMIEKPTVAIEPVVTNNQLSYRIDIKLKGGVNELAQTISEAKLQEMAQAQVLKEIKETYEYGLKRKIDLYQLAYRLYLQDPGKWKTYFGPASAFPLKRDSLQSIDIQVKIENSGKYHLRK